jgi:hypothetical protein
MLYITNHVIEFIGTTLLKTAILLMAISLVFCKNDLRKALKKCVFSRNYVL